MLDIARDVRCFAIRTTEIRHALTDALFEHSNIITYFSAIVNIESEKHFCFIQKTFLNWLTFALFCAIIYELSCFII